MRFQGLARAVAHEERQSGVRLKTIPPVPKTEVAMVIATLRTVEPSCFVAAVLGSRDGRNAQAAMVDGRSRATDLPASVAVLLSSWTGIADRPAELEVPLTLQRFLPTANATVLPVATATSRAGALVLPFASVVRLPTLARTAADIAERLEERSREPVRNVS